MTTIHRAKYLGPYNFRILGPADLAKAGVESGFKETSFPRRVFVEVANEEIATALVKNPQLFSKFEQDTIEVEPEVVPEAETPAEPQALTLEEANDSGTGAASIDLTSTPSARKSSKSST